MSISSVGSNDDTNQLLRANAAERDANRRVSAAAERVQTAERESEQAIEKIREQNEGQYLALSSRQEAALESQQLKGYERIRDLKRAQQAELRKVNREGDTENSKVREHFRTEISNAENRGQQQLREIQSQTDRKVEYERKAATLQEEELREQHAERLQYLKGNQDDRIEKVNEAYRREYDRLKTETEQSQERQEKAFNTRFDETLKHSADVIDRLENRASQQLRQIRDDTSEKLSAYRSRQSDPFYKLKDMHARLRETGSEYILTAQVPEYEQEHLSASVKGDNLVISGYRRNEEKLERSPGHTVGSASFESFHESFPLSWPVEKDRLTREFDGNSVTIRVPKKNQYAFKQPERPKAEKARVEPPHFPENIPHIHHHPTDKSQAELAKEPELTPKDSGSGTLN